MLLLVCVLSGLIAFVSGQLPYVTSIDADTEHVYVQRYTSIEAEITETRSKATLQVLGGDLYNGQQFVFKDSCGNLTEGTPEEGDMFMTLYDVSEDELDFFYRKRGHIDLTINQTQQAYGVPREICMTQTGSPNDTFFNSTGLFVTVFEITHIAEIEHVAKVQELVERLRAYKYSTVAFYVEGIGLAERLQLSPQYTCKNLAFSIPVLGETPQNLFDVNANGSRAIVEFTRAHTDLTFEHKDICVSRGNPGVYDFSGWTGISMTVFSPCIEDACNEGACQSVTGNCLCDDGIGGYTICAGDNRNLTAFINQTAPGTIPDKPMCRDVKWDHFEPSRAVDQLYYVNPTGFDRFPVWCDMTGGGWATINATHKETQVLSGGNPAEYIPTNITYDISDQRMEDIRNLSLNWKQDITVKCRADFSDFACPRMPYHQIHESLWRTWFWGRVWPVYSFDGCCFRCCSHSHRWEQTTATFYHNTLPVRNVATYFGGADDNTEELVMQMEPVQFY